MTKVLLPLTLEPEASHGQAVAYWDEVNRIRTVADILSLRPVEVKIRQVSLADAPLGLEYSVELRGGFLQHRMHELRDFKVLARFVVTMRGGRLTIECRYIHAGIVLPDDTELFKDMVDVTRKEALTSSEPADSWVRDADLTGWRDRLWAHVIGLSLSVNPDSL